MDFPRKISTKTTEGRQILVNDKPQALARFKQANYLDCRISAYTELDDSPNFLFIDIDTLDEKVLLKVLNFKFRALKWTPTVLFTGSGYHIYQPVAPIKFEALSNFNGHVDIQKQFLKFAGDYLSHGYVDKNHNPSLKSCMVRIPGSISSKNGHTIKIIQEWDGNRSDVTPLLGMFYAYLESKKIKERKYEAITANSKFANNSNSKINWIEKLLKTPLDDYRKGIVNLVLAPYFMNIRKITCAIATAQIKRWLESCAVERKLDFYTDAIIDIALRTAQKSGYKPMRLDTLKQRNPTILSKLMGGHRY